MLREKYTYRKFSKCLLDDFFVIPCQIYEFFDLRNRFGITICSCLASGQRGKNTANFTAGKDRSYLKLKIVMKI